MDDADLQLLANHESWQHVLSTYVDLAAQRPVASDPASSEHENGPRWVSRILESGNLSADELSTVHGHLIAMGWLHFQLEDGQNGLSYRVSTDGRRIMKRLASWIASGAAEVNEEQMAA